MSNVLLPPYYVIEPTDLCNFRCAICPHSGTWNEKRHGMMDINLFEVIINQIKYSAKVIQLYWLGEPLLNPKLFDMILCCKQFTDAKIIISTNGALLSPHVIQKLRESGLDEIIISVDACENQQIYEQIRVGGNLKKLNDNIEYLLKNKGDIHVVLQFIDMYINKSEKALFIKRWGHCGCDLDISCLYTWSNQLPWLNEASDNLSPVRNNKRVPCADLWNKMVIRWNGDVSACCFDYDNKLPLGNCNNDSLLNIWNGSKAEQLRTDQLRGVFDKRLCLQCDAWAEPNEYKEMFHL